MNEMDCPRCCYFEFYQDTDDDGRAIAPPINCCNKGHKLFPTSCNDFKDAWLKQ